MPSLNVNIDYFGHPKTKSLLRLLGKGSEVLPLKVWAYTARYFPKDGRLTGISAAELESECQWWGRAGEMIRVMLEVVFLEDDNGTLVVHDWLKHEGHLDAFHERAIKGAQARWDKARGNASSIALSNAPTLPALPPCNALDTAAFAAGAEPEPERGSVPKPRKKPPPTTPKEPADFRQLTDFWKEAWAAANGGTAWVFQRTDGVMLSAIFSRVGYDLAKAKAVIDLYLRDSDRFYEGHPLTLLKRDAVKFIARINGANKGTHNGKRYRTAADRGEYESNLPVGVQSIDDLPD